MPNHRHITRRIVFGVLTLYVAGLAWGYARLPSAAVKHLTDYPAIMVDREVYLSSDVDVAPIQRWHLRRLLPPSATSMPIATRVHASVKWNALIVARVHSSHVTSFNGHGGVEGKDALYANIFGAWVRLRTFSHVIS